MLLTISKAKASGLSEGLEAYGINSIGIGTISFIQALHTELSSPERSSEKVHTTWVFGVKSVDA